MDAMQERFESLSVDDEDTIAYRRSSARRRSPLYRNLLALLTLVVMSGWGTWHYTDVLQRLTGVPPAPISAPATNTSTRPPMLEPYVQSLPQIADKPRPLAECIDADNLIDADVARCRFGKLSQPVQDANAHGMVSARYMAQYTASQ